MKTIYKEKLPKCDFCNQTTKEMFDAPTKLGAWAHMCSICYPQHKAGNADVMGYKMLTKKPVSKEIKNLVQDKRLIAKLRGSLDEAVMDSVVELECPICKCFQSMEIDCGDYICGGCGQKLSFQLDEMF